MKRKYTLEEHLHRVCECDETKRSLESVYDLQKKKMTRYLSSVVATYPTYSSHDAWHSVNIVSAIEGILGKERIKKLTGMDTFLLLMCSYMHDIGMLYTEKEVRELWITEDFQNFLSEYQSESSTIGKAASLLLEAESGRIKEYLTWTLDVRQAITIVLMEYFRPQHGRRIQKLTERQNQIGALLCVEESFLPKRIIKVINKISMSHTGSFENMLKELVMVDTFDGEEFHPRLIAWLLRMGDLCDLDNDRFNRIGIATFGTLQDENLAHYFKHCSVETLYISTEQIWVIANVDKKAIKDECAVEWMKDDACDNKKKFEQRYIKVYQQTIREHVSWKSWMENEINLAKLNVNKIFPKNWSRKIPELEYKILLNGAEISSGNQNLRFSFSQEKAYSLIENISIYQNKSFIFIRELIQNAIDASKIQIWREIKDRVPAYMYEISPFQVARLFPDIFEKYAIHVNTEYHAETDEVNFLIEDSGIGISVDEFQNHILTTGSSWKNRKQYQKEFKDMPEWLRPTGAFGIGLHTVFTVTDEMEIYTKSDAERHANTMILYSGKKSGYAFCQKADEERARGTSISFTFRLTDAQKAQCFGEQTNLYLREYDDEYEDLVRQYIQEYCETPIVPIFLNGGQPVALSLTGSTWCEELTCLNSSGYKGNIDVDNRYEYCFGYNFKYIIIYDKKNRYLLNFAIAQYDDDEIIEYGEYTQYNETSFMGMTIDENIVIPGNIIQVKYVDILAGMGSDVIDAARMKFTYDAKKQIERSLEEIIVFAKNCYMDLMVEQRQDETVKAYREEIYSLASEYYSGHYTNNDIWKEVCNKKAYYFKETDTRRVKSLDVRIVTYLIGLNLVDEIIKLDIGKLVNGIDGNDWKQKCKCMQIKAFDFLDYLLVKWKSDWRVSEETFSKSYFDVQIVSILEYYCVIWSHMIIQYVIRNGRINHYEEIWRKLIVLEFYRRFLKISKWKKVTDIPSKIFGIIMTYRGGRDEKNLYPLRNLALLFPGSAIAFREWRYRGTYGLNDFMSLELEQPYLYCIMDIPHCLDVSSLQRKVWNMYVRESIYGGFCYDMLRPKALKSIIDEASVTISSVNNEMVFDYVPVIKSFDVTELKKSKGGWNIILEAGDQVKLAIQGTKIEKEEMYKKFWQKIIFESQDDEEVYIEIPAFDEYREIAEFRNGYNEWLGIECVYAIVPAWNYINEIREFINECEENEWTPEESVEIIAERELDRKVINYLYKIKGGGSAEKRAQIEDLYRRLLLELFQTWNMMPKG